MKILFVEDDVDVSTMYSAQLELDDHDIQVVRTAQDALDALDEGQFDLIVLDILLPGSNGISVLHELQSYEDWRHLPVVVLSNLSPDDLSISHKQLKKLGVRDYLVKMETTPQDLATAVTAAA